MKPAVYRAFVIVDLLKRGWKPPPLTSTQSQRLLDDMERLSHDRRGQQARGDSLNLTAVERDVLMLAAQGLTVRATALRLRRSDETIKSALKQVRRKLGARNTVHAVALALSAGVIDPVAEGV